MPVLISYSRLDSIRARLLRRALTRHGIEVWLDEHDIELGGHIEERLRELIWNCDMMLVLITPHSSLSAWLRWEVEVALERERRGGQQLIIPILLSGDIVPSSLYGRRYADFRSHTSQEKDFNSLLRKLLNQKSAEDPTLSNNVDLFSPRGLPVISPPPPIIEEREAKEQKSEPPLRYLESPLVGTLYRRPSPDGPPFIQIGDVTRIGDVVLIIEAMKVMNEIETPIEGEIVEILAEEGQPVEFGEPLIAFRTRTPEKE